jgi:uncharacterized protein
MRSSRQCASGIRTVSTRFGLVWGGDGGMLPLMAPPFRFALGTRLGSGRQWMSWVAIDDLLGAVEAALHDESLSGAVNVTSPRPVTNREFTETLGKVLNRPTPFAVPRAVLERGLGRDGERDVADEPAREAGSPRRRPASAGSSRTSSPPLRFELGK